MTPLGILATMVLAAAAVTAPRVGLIALWRRFQHQREKTRQEDALKHILAWQDRSKPASLESLSGSLRLKPSIALRLATQLEAGGWVRCGASGIQLTASGQRRAVQVVRAHRLWERHLSDDANMPIGRLHHLAERAEHSLSRTQVARLDAHLGHPEHDPHGDPIPSPDGTVALLEAASLNDWPSGTPARVAHIEDEPDAVFRAILATGLRPGHIVRVHDLDQATLAVEFEGRQARIDRTLAINIHVAEVRDGDLPPAGAIRLASMSQGARSEVVGLDRECTGFSRRRLLDLGLTPGASVEVALDNTFGDPRAFRVRGTTIALRAQQAEQVWVRPQPSEAEWRASQ